MICTTVCKLLLILKSCFANEHFGLNLKALFDLIFFPANSSFERKPIEEKSIISTLSFFGVVLNLLSISVLVIHDFDLFLSRQKNQLQTEMRFDFKLYFSWVWYSMSKNKLIY